MAALWPVIGYSADNAARPPVFPTTREMRESGGDLLLTEQVKIGIPRTPSANDLFLARNQVRDIARAFAEDCRLLEPALPAVAEWQGTGKLRSAVEEQYLTERLIHSSQFDVLVQFGNPHSEYGGTFGSQTSGMTRRAPVAELAPDEFMVIGFDAHVTVRPLKETAPAGVGILRRVSSHILWRYSRRRVP